MRSIVVRQLGVVVDPAVLARIDVHGDGGQLRDGMEHVVSGTLGDLVCLTQAQVGVGDDQRFGMDRVSDPARAHG